VPLHPMRIMRRRFNQSALIAKALGKRLDLPVDVLALKRTRATPMQQGLNASQRRRNVRGAFAVDRARAKRIQGHDIMLIDDVYTTGATAEACARALRKAGAGRIGVLTATRVVGPEAAIL
ncbi:MAG: phosphoribosyltransferase family protein, partial [Pseudomonadota bacterium]